MTQETWRATNRVGDWGTYWLCPSCGKQWCRPDSMADLYDSKKFTCTICEDPDPPKCKFMEAWIGRCNNPCDKEKEYCPEHSRPRYTCVCGEKAVGNCKATMGLVCGSPVCTGSFCDYHGGTHKDKQYVRDKYLERLEADGYVGTD